MHNPTDPYPISRKIIQLAPERDEQAWEAWAAHVAAGRIGPPAPPPATPTPGRDLGLASLAAILGHATPAPRP